MEISVYGRSEFYRLRPDILGRFASGPALTFSDAAPGKVLSLSALEVQNEATA